MSEDHTAQPDRTVSTLTTIIRAGGRIAADLVGIGLWVLFLTLVFLSTGWPRWAFYGLLILGVGFYVRFTAPWLRSSQSNPHSETEAESTAEES